MYKKIILIFLIFFINFNAYSYEPSQKDIKLIEKTTQIIDNYSETKNETWFNRNLNSFNYFLDNYKKDDRVKYVITQIKNSLEENLEILKQKNEEELEELLENRVSFQRQSFFDEYGQNITSWLDVPQKCIEHFDFVDEIAKEQNFPTELILAMWGREFNCNLANPGNWWGPFQITSLYYAPWDITLEQFRETVITFIEFSRNKWDYYNYDSYHNLKDRFWQENISMSYDNYSIRDIRLHWILYNGITSTATLENHSFSNANLNSSISSNSDWIATRFLKILNWRIQNNK